MAMDNYGTIVKLVLHTLLSTLVYHVHYAHHSVLVSSSNMHSHWITSPLPANSNTEFVLPTCKAKYIIFIGWHTRYWTTMCVINLMCKLLGQNWEVSHESLTCKIRVIMCSSPPSLRDGHTIWSANVEIKHGLILHWNWKLITDINIELYWEIKSEKPKNVGCLYCIWLKQLWFIFIYIFIYIGNNV